MINLLPPEVYQKIKYGRQNTKMLNWLMALVVAYAGIGIIVFLGIFYMRQLDSNYSKQINQQQTQLKEQKLDETQQRVEELSSNLKLAVDVLSREVLFSKLLEHMGTVIPPNASLSDLKIDKLEGGVDIIAIAKDYNSASQVFTNIQDSSNEIFDKADLVSISCVGNSSDPNYPCTVTIRAQFAKDNPFLFINKSTAGVQQ